MTKRNKHFYTHLVDTASISLALADVEMKQDERRHLIMIVEANLHNTVIDIVLSELSEEDKHTFLTHLHEDNHEKIWELLRKKSAGFEEKIKKTVASLIQEFLTDIETVHKNT